MIPPSIYQVSHDQINICKILKNSQNKNFIVLNLPFDVVDEKKKSLLAKRII
jgi:hypothetical protein